MEDLEITLRVRKQLELRRQAETDSKLDPSLYTPWGRMGLEDYQEKQLRRDELPAKNSGQYLSDHSDND